MIKFQDNHGKNRKRICKFQTVGRKKIEQESKQTNLKTEKAGEKREKWNTEKAVVGNRNKKVGS